MKILFVASECAPFIKTGGLADVIGAAPKALVAAGADVKTLIPAYPALAAHAAAGETALGFDDLFGGPARIVSVQAEGAALLLLEAPHLFDRSGGPYQAKDGADWPDNDLRFAALARAGAEIGRAGLGPWAPDVIHAHDWQAGLVPAYLRTGAEGGAGCGARTPVVMTIHNIAFQGLFDPARMGALGLDPALYTAEGAEFYGQLGFLKAGLAMADRITTVSPTYAAELLTPEFGVGLDGLLRARREAFHGVLNGVDLAVWDPETDPALAAPFSARALMGKAANRAAVERRFGLDAGDGPLFCVISRLTAQKGFDMLLEHLPLMAATGARLAVLGTGEPALERAFAGAAASHPGVVGAIIGYDEELAHLMQGGADAILIPSRFEPCGLTQLYGLRYGTLPIVARTGGLADTVIDANEAALRAECATGFQFPAGNTAMLGHAITRAARLFRQKRVWAGMMRRAMRHPVGWDQSAAAYLDIYRAAAGRSA